MIGELMIDKWWMFQTPNLPNLLTHLNHLAILGPHLHLCRQNCGVFQAPVSLIKAQWVHQMIFLCCA